MRTMTLGRKVLIVGIIAIVIAAMAYCDRPTYYDGKGMAVYYHSRANCERIRENEVIERHSWIQARMINGLTKCPNCG